MSSLVVILIAYCSVSFPFFFVFYESGYDFQRCLGISVGWPLLILVYAIKGVWDELDRAMFR